MKPGYRLTPIGMADFSDLDKVYFLDVETTGLNPEVSDILQCAIIDGTGEVLLNKFYDSWLLSWPEAELVNGITKESVEGLPCFEQESSEVTRILADAKVIAGYNVRFDLSFLEAGGVAIPHRCQIVDVMEDFSRSQQVYVLKRHSLRSACRHINHELICAHDALDDSVATLAVARHLRGASE